MSRRARRRRAPSRPRSHDYGAPRDAIQANLMRRNDARGRYALTGAGRRRISARGRVPGTILSFGRRDVLRSGVPQRKPASGYLKDYALRQLLQHPLGVGFETHANREATGRSVTEPA
jgi:hypothetical protein